jgi:hypothetical protein
MNRTEIEDRLWTSRERMIATLGLAADWWPNTTAQGNDACTPFAMSFFIDFALDRCVGQKLTLAANSGERLDPRQRTIEALWNNAAREHSTNEVLVDFSVHNWDAASPIQLTGESEMHPYHGVGDSLTTADDYSWDFYKLLVVPSATRLFCARVGRSAGRGATDRINDLLSTLQGLIDLYGPALLRPNDELGGVLLPSRRSLAPETRVFWLDRGRLRAERVMGLGQGVDPDAPEENVAAEP